MISKTLLSNIIGADINNVYEIGSNPNLSGLEIPYSVKGNGDLLNINIFELVNKAKKWALSKDFSLLSGFDKETNLQTCFINFGYGLTECSLDVWWDQDFTAETEEEAVFKAAQYILDEVSKNA